MRRIKVLSLLILALVVFSSCGNQNTSGAPTGMKELSNEITDYYVYIPEDWTGDISTGVVSALAYDKSNISVMELAAGEGIYDVDSYFAEYEKQLKEVLTDYKLEGEPTKATLGGYAANDYRYSGSLSGTTYMYRQVITLINRSFAGVTNDYRVYIITYTAKSEYYEEHLDEVDRIIESFKFKD